MDAASNSASGKVHIIALPTSRTINLRQAGLQIIAIRTKSDDKTMHTNVLFFGFSFISPLFMHENIRKDYTPSVFER